MSTTPDTPELKALAAFLAASFDSKLDGAKMREAMEWTLGPREVVAPPVPEPIMRLTGYQLREALEFLAPDDEPHQLESEVCIQHGPERTHDEGTDPAGLYCWLRDCPEEGSIPLTGDAPTEAAHTQSASEPDILEPAEDRQLFERTLEEFDDCGETSTDYETLMRWANKGWLECTHFVSTPAGRAAVNSIDPPLFATPRPASEPVARIVSSGPNNFPLLQWLSPEHSFRAPIGSLLYPGPKEDQHDLF